MVTEITVDTDHPGLTGTAFQSTLQPACASLAMIGVGFKCASQLLFSYIFELFKRLPVRCIVDQDTELSEYLYRLLHSIKACLAAPYVGIHHSLLRPFFLFPQHPGQFR